MAGSSATLRLHHVALRVADCEASLALYSGVLGLRETRRSQGADGVASVWVQAGEMVLMLERRLRGAGAETGSGHLLAFAVDDLREWELKLAQAGVVVEDRTTHTLYLRDPDGHRLGLTTYPDAR